jgi:hypothetical protein
LSNCASDQFRGTSVHANTAEIIRVTVSWKPNAGLECKHTDNGASETMANYNLQVPGSLQTLRIVRNSGSDL